MADERTLLDRISDETRWPEQYDGPREKLLREAAARLAQLENTAANYKALFDELCGYVAFMCEHFGDKRDEIPCDAWRLRDHVMRAKTRLAQLEAFRAEVEAARGAVLEFRDSYSADGSAKGRIIRDAADELAVALRAALERVGKVGGEECGVCGGAVVGDECAQCVRRIIGKVGGEGGRS